MKRFILQFVITLLLAIAFEHYLPWWTIAVAGALGAFIVGARYGFLCGFLSVGILWFAKALSIDAQAAQPLAEQVAQLLTLRSKWLLLALTAIVGGLAGGLGAWGGAHVTHLILPTKR